MFFTLLSTKNHIRLPNSIDNLRFLTTAISYCQKAGSIQHSDMKFFKVGVLNTICIERKEGRHQPTHI